MEMAIVRSMVGMWKSHPIRQGSCIDILQSQTAKTLQDGVVMTAVAGLADEPLWSRPTKTGSPPISLLLRETRQGLQIRWMESCIK